MKGWDRVSRSEEIASVKVLGWESAPLLGVGVVWCQRREQSTDGRHTALKGTVRN